MVISGAAPKSLAGRKILVVEDDYFIAYDLCSMLEQLGAEVQGPAASVDAASSLISSGCQIDAAVLDVNLRDMMVFPVADALKARGIPFVFATGYEQTEIPDRFAGVQHCEKPVDHKILQQAFSV